MTVFVYVNTSKQVGAALVNFDRIQRKVQGRGAFLTILFAELNFLALEFEQLSLHLY